MDHVHTPEQARALWCPFVTFLFILDSPAGPVPVGAGNRMPGGQQIAAKAGLQAPDNPVESRCISTRCSQWVWTDQKDAQGNALGHCGQRARP